jgi:hypothetical protein
LAVAGRRNSDSLLPLGAPLCRLPLLLLCGVLLAGSGGSRLLEKRAVRRGGD